MCVAVEITRASIKQAYNRASVNISNNTIIKVFIKHQILSVQIILYAYMPMCMHTHTHRYLHTQVYWLYINYHKTDITHTQIPAHTSIRTIHKLSHNLNRQERLEVKEDSHEAGIVPDFKKVFWVDWSCKDALWYSCTSSHISQRQHNYEVHNFYNKLLLQMFKQKWNYCSLPLDHLILEPKIFKYGFGFNFDFQVQNMIPRLMVTVSISKKK